LIYMARLDSNQRPLPCQGFEVKQANNLQDPDGDLSPCKHLPHAVSAYRKTYRV
jgi:hypothetical protein